MPPAQDRYRTPGRHRVRRTHQIISVGGTQSGAANKIAFNGRFGIMVFPCSSRNSIRGNSFFPTTVWESISVQSGVTANDATDSDVGANNLQNFPVLTSVMSIGNSTTIQGSLKSTPNTTFQIDFYTSAALDPSGNGEGAQFFNTTSVTTNGNGDATINVTFPVRIGDGSSCYRNCYRSEWEYIGVFGR